MIVGDGTDAANLHQQVKGCRYPESRVTFTGRVRSDDDLVELHRVGTVLTVMPSPAELQSIATLEAMASGQPIVAVDAGALRELCQDGVNRGTVRAR